MSSSAVRVWCRVLLLSACVALCSVPVVSGASFNYSLFFQPLIGCTIATDSAGSYYVGLCDQGTVLKYNSGLQLVSTFDAQVATTLTTLASNSSGLLSFGGTMAISASGVIWFNDIANLRLVGVNDQNPTQPLLISTASIQGGWEIGVSPASDNVWTTSLCHPQAGAVQYAPNGTIVSLIGAVSDPVNLPSTYCIMGVQPDPSGAFVYIGGCQQTGPTGFVRIGLSEFQFNSSAVGQCDIRKVSVSTGQVVQVIQPTGTSGIGFWEDMDISPVTGDLYANDYYSGVVYHLNSSGALLGNFTTGANLALLPSGAVVSLGPGGYTIEVLTTAGAPVSSINITTDRFAYPVGVAVPSSGSPVYSWSEEGGPVAVLNTGGNITGYIGAGLLAYPELVATDSSGSLYVVDATQSLLVQKFSSSGALLTTNFSDPLMNAPGEYYDGYYYEAFAFQGLAVNPLNQQVVATVYNQSGNGYIVVWSAAGQLLQRIPAIAPEHVAVTAAGAIVYVEFGVSPAAIVTVALNGSSSHFNVSHAWYPYGLAVSPDGRIFVSDFETNQLFSFSLQGQQLAVVSPSSYALFMTGLAFSSPNVLYVVDLFNSRIVTFNVGAYGSPGGNNNNPPASAASPAIQGSASAALLLALLSAVLAMVVV